MSSRISCYSHLTISCKLSFFHFYIYFPFNSHIAITSGFLLWASYFVLWREVLESSISGAAGVSLGMRRLESLTEEASFSSRTPRHMKRATFTKACPRSFLPASVGLRSCRHGPEQHKWGTGSLGSKLEEDSLNSSIHPVSSLSLYQL